MLPSLPSALDPEFAMKNSRDLVKAVPQHEPAHGGAETEIDHHCQVCPTCSHTLTGHRCKLVCTRCGYYMSCADYY